MIILYLHIGLPLFSSLSVSDAMKACIIAAVSRGPDAPVDLTYPPSESCEIKEPVGAVPVVLKTSEVQNLG